jgi:phage-related minor tail protein
MLACVYVCECSAHDNIVSLCMCTAVKQREASAREAARYKREMSDARHVHKLAELEAEQIWKAKLTALEQEKAVELEAMASKLAQLRREAANKDAEVTAAREQQMQLHQEYAGVKEQVRGRVCVCVFCVNNVRCLLGR